MQFREFPEKNGLINCKYIHAVYFNAFNHSVQFELSSSISVLEKYQYGMFAALGLEISFDDRRDFAAFLLTILKLIKIEFWSPFEVLKGE